MTTLEAITKLDLLLDKYGSPYFTQDEKINFLNMAQLEFLNRLFPDSSGGVVNFEFDNNVAQTIKPLLYNVDLTNSQYSNTVNGTSVSTSQLQTALGITVGDGAARVFRIASVGIYVSDVLFTPVKYTKHNDYFKNLNNTFKQPTTAKPVYTETAIGINILPQTTAIIRVVVVKYPKLLTAGNSPELGDYEMNQIITIAAQLASVGLRDPELLQQIQNSNIAK